MSKEKPSADELATYAEEVRGKLDLREQDAVFAAAIELGYLAARADGEVDDDERKALVDAVEKLSKGMVIELEVDAIIERVDADDSSDDDKAKAVGKRLKELDAARPALLIGAFVAVATSGVDKAEREVLKKAGRAAGLKVAVIDDALKTVDADGD